LLLKFDTFLTAGEPYRHWPQLANMAHFLDNAGQRGLMVPLLLIFTAYAVYRMRSWRPLVLTSVALLAINIVVGAMKYITARPSPRLGPAPLLDHSVIGSVGLFPSGHAANAVLIWGLAVYIGAVALGWSARTVKRGVWTVAIVTGVVAICSLFQQFHWPTDLVAGVMVGGAILGATIAADRWRPGWYEPLDKATRVSWEQRHRYRQDVDL
jgi:undecaprenyl-diphosphatase